VQALGPKGRFLWAKASPLYDSSGKIVGAIEAIRDVTERKLTEERLERSRSELRIASDIQRSFLPEKVPTLQGFDLAAISIPAMEVGGDFYDFISGPDGSLGVVIADVSGKSIPAALFMALSRTIVRVNATHHERGIEIIRDANDTISEDSRAGMFVTLFYGVLNQAKKTLVYANAGHPPPLLLRAGSNECTALDVTGIAIGAMPGAEYEERSVDLSNGDVLILYTDGITEAINSKDEQYGIDRLCSIVKESRSFSAREIMRRILREVSDFTDEQPQFDDITMIIAKVET
jgi:sigma-B regulation protein RsbU (phosphoserine phosphatase)